MENPKTTAIFERLKKALKVETDGDLAARLGLSYQAFNKRKVRGSLPREEVETLIDELGLNPAWVYSGEDPMYEGGEAQQKREQDYRDLVAQMTAMSLHNETRRAVEPLIKGLVWGDSSSVERWLEDVGGLSSEERVIVAAYRAGDADVQNAMTLIAQRGPVPKQSGAKMKFHAPVTQAVGGDLITQSNTLNNAESVPTQRRNPRK